MSEHGAWEAFVAEVEQHVTPEWAHNARQHGHQGWIKLIALVDIQNAFTQPQIVEKIALTMADLAQNKPEEQAGWNALHDSAVTRRRELLEKIDRSAADLLSPELHQLYLRSATPLPAY